MFHQRVETASEHILPHWIIVIFSVLKILISLEKEEVVKEVYLKALNQLVTNKEPALEMMRGIPKEVSDTADPEAEVGKAVKALDEAVILFQDYMDVSTTNGSVEKELTNGIRAAVVIRQYRNGRFSCWLEKFLEKKNLLMINSMIASATSSEGFIRLPLS